MSVRLVQCVKMGRELPGLTRPPFPGALGQRVFEHVSQQGWALWQQQQTLLINHHGLSLFDRRAQAFLMQQLEEFFFGQGQGPEAIEGWAPEPPG
ncbi:MAG: oxidative damage protection protein [Anaerolineales bacterium]|nr:oxidative damage protection protein [Anaerolineales bacterium]